jgi:tripartite-type tricarboxylate transporter receptor subunit TctC
MRALAAILLAFLVGGVAAAQAQQQDYPTRPVRLVVPYAPGGTTDILARIIAERFQPVFGQPLVVDIRPGAGGTIGSDHVAKAPADGYTILIGGPGTHATAQALYPNLSYDQQRDFAPISMVASLPNLVVVNPTLPVRSIAELIAHARANPGRLHYGSAGNGTTTHLSGELFRLLTGAEIVHVPYRGSGAALIDLQGGQIQLMFENLPGAIGFAREGRLRGLAVTSPRRAPAAPDLPTVEEAGVPGYSVLSWFVLVAPAATPRPIVARLNEGARRILDDPAVRQRVAELGAETIAGTPEEAAAVLAAETERWNRVIRDAGIRIQ